MKPLQCGEFSFAILANSSTACSRSIWNLPGTTLNFGITKIRTITAKTISTPETIKAEITAGLTSISPNKLIL